MTAAIRTDVFDVYVFKREPLRFLQLLRTRTPLHKTWQPVMGHVEPGESTLAAMWREVREETSLCRGDPALLGAWALEGVHPFYLAGQDVIMLSPRFALEMAAEWEPTLNHEHSALRWINAADVAEHFMWPGQRACIEEIAKIIVARSLAEPHLRISITT